jgi:hypothetical protein
MIMMPYADADHRCRSGEQHRSGTPQDGAGRRFLLFAEFQHRAGVMGTAPAATGRAWRAAGSPQVPAGSPSAWMSCVREATPSFRNSCAAASVLGAPAATSRAIRSSCAVRGAAGTPEEDRCLHRLQQRVPACAQIQRQQGEGRCR